MDEWMNASLVDDCINGEMEGGGMEGGMDGCIPG